MDEDIKPTPEEEGKEFSYFPFEGLPPVTTQVVEEILECNVEIGNITIEHADPVTKITEITLPIKEDKLIKLQETDPQIKQLRNKWNSNNIDRNIYMSGEQHLEKKISRKCTHPCTHP